MLRVVLCFYATNGPSEDQPLQIRMLRPVEDRLPVDEFREDVPVINPRAATIAHAESAPIAGTSPTRPRSPR
jgi:hypothetical protein